NYPFFWYLPVWSSSNQKDNFFFYGGIRHPLPAASSFSPQCDHRGAFLPHRKAISYEIKKRTVLMNCPHPYLTYLLPRRRQKSTQNYPTRLRLKRSALCIYLQNKYNKNTPP